MTSSRNGMNIRRKLDRDTFVDKVIEHGMRAKEAMQVLNPELDGQALSVKVSRWLKHPDIIKSLAHEVSRLNLTKSDIANILQGKLLSVILDDSEKTSDQITAVMGQAKLSGIIQDNNNIAVNILNSEALHNLVRKYRQDVDDSGALIEDKENKKAAI